jgi:hypothetical protein
VKNGGKRAAVAEGGSAVRPGVLLSVFGATILLSAALLFSVQPLFAKVVLPTLGGAPAVWSVALVFFQAALLAGYFYAHVLTTYLPGTRSVVLHLVVITIATIGLPLGVAEGWGRPRSSGCSGCSPFRSDCRSSRCRRMRRCCRHGSRARDIRRRRTHTSYMPRAMSAALRHS